MQDEFPSSDFLCLIQSLESILRGPDPHQLREMVASWSQSLDQKHWPPIPPQENPWRYLRSHLHPDSPSLSISRQTSVELDSPDKETSPSLQDSELKISVPDLSC